MIATTPLLRAAALALLILCVTTPALAGTDPLHIVQRGHNRQPCFFAEDVSGVLKVRRTWRFESRGFSSSIFFVAF